jgi:hypothetical protein
MDLKGDKQSDIIHYFMNKEVKGAWDIKAKL